MRRLAGLPGLLAALLLALVWAPAFAAPAPKFPALTGRVVDDAHVLSPQIQADLTGKLAALEQKTSRQLVVVTLPSLQGYDIEDYGYQLGRAWGLGQKGLNNGVLFIVAPSEHKVRIEVGYGMEPILTDALSSVILQQAVLPKFHAGDIPGGVVAGTNALIQQMSLDPSSAEAKAAAAAPPARHHHGSPIAGLIPLVIIFFVFTSIFRGRRGGGGGGLGWILPLMFLSSGRSGGWGGGGGGWNNDSGGGGDDDFSGGGGSFGGGGASGDW